MRDLQFSGNDQKVTGTKNFIEIKQKKDKTGSFFTTRFPL